RETLLCSRRRRHRNSRRRWGEKARSTFFFSPPIAAAASLPPLGRAGSRRAGKGGAGAGRKGEKGERPRENSNSEKTICGCGSEGRRLCVRLVCKLRPFLLLLYIYFCVGPDPPGLCSQLRHVVGVAACLLCFCLLYSIACLAFPLPLLGPSVAVFVSATGCLYLARARSSQKTTSMTLISSPPP
ncbi:hypothetical protein E2320_002666, partial [Naja naja]